MKTILDIPLFLSDMGTPEGKFLHRVKYVLAFYSPPIHLVRYDINEEAPNLLCASIQATAENKSTISIVIPTDDNEMLIASDKCNSYFDIKQEQEFFVALDTYLREEFGFTGFSDSSSSSSDEDIII